MAKRGRKRKPAEVHRLNGNPGRRAENVVEGPAVAAVVGPPDPPAFLTESAKAEWSRVVPLLAAAGKLTPLHRAPLAAYCQAWADWERERLKIAETGIVQTFRDDKGSVKASIVSPHVTASLKFLEKLRQFAADLGIEPAIAAAPAGKPEDDGKPPGVLAFAKRRGNGGSA